MSIYILQKRKVNEIVVINHFFGIKNKYFLDNAVRRELKRTWYALYTV